MWGIVNNCSTVTNCSTVRQLLNVICVKGKCPPVSRSGNEFQTIATKTPEGVPSTHVRSCVTGYRDNLIIDDGIRYWVNMLCIKSGKKVVVCPSTCFFIISYACYDWKINSIFESNLTTKFYLY